MKEINEAFDAMFKELQKTGDPYDYPNATWSVIDECKKAVQSRLESLEKDAARYEMILEMEWFQANADFYLDLPENETVAEFKTLCDGKIDLILSRRVSDELDAAIDTAMRANKEE